MSGQQFCSVVWGYDCLNAPGFGISGRGSASNSDGPRVRASCQACGDPCCANCRVGSRGHWTCKSCEERERYFNPQGAEKIKRLIQSVA